MNTDSEQLILKAIDAAGNKDNAKARGYLAEVLKQDPRNARAWYILSQVVEEPERAVYCLNQVLKIQPDNIQTKERLRKLENQLSLPSNELPRENDISLHQYPTPLNRMVITGVGLIILVFVGLVYWYYYGPCGKTRVGNSTRAIAGVFEDVVAILESVNISNPSSISKGIDDLETANQDLESIRVPNCLDDFKKQSMEIMQLYLESMNLTLEIANLRARGVDINNLYESAVRVDLMREKVYKNEIIRSDIKRRMDLATEELHSVVDCAPWCP